MFGVIRKRTLIIVAVMVAVVTTAAVAIGVGTRTVAAARVKRLLPVYSVEDDSRIAITFDASWGAERTRLIVDTLTAHGIRATFFLTGIWIDAYPEETAYIAENGMEIGNHSHHHYAMIGMSPEEIREEVTYVNRRVLEITGRLPRVFRAPYGDYGNTLLTTLREMDLTCVQWDVDSLDWKGLSSEELQTRIIPRVRGGSVILCHNNSLHIAEALPAIIERLSERYAFVTVSELLADKRGGIDNTGKLHR